MEYDFIRPWNTLDPWQEKVLKQKKNLAIRSGRQTGKSTVISIKSGDFALENSNKTIMIIAKVERQAHLLFEKILSYIYFKDKNQIKKGKDRPTKHKLKLKNGSTIYCLPAGDTGYGIRGYTIDLLIADEAAFIPEEVWTAVTPMIAITKGIIWLLSTPWGKQGYFYRAFQENSGFSCFHISSQDCPRKDQEHLNREKAWMSKAQYAQEYLGEFVDELRQLYPDKLIKQCQTIQKPKKQIRVFPRRKYYLGVDIARMGEDLSVFSIIDGTNRKHLINIDNIITRKTLTTETTRMIIHLNDKYNFKQIFIDDGGMGVGVLDQLLEHPKTRRKVVAINNTSRPLTKDEKKKKRLIKSDIYNNLLGLMERAEIHLLDDPEVFMSLKSIQYEYEDNGKIKIWGKDAHHADALTRASWCVKDKHLNIYIY